MSGELRFRRARKKIHRRYRKQVRRPAVDRGSMTGWWMGGYRPVVHPYQGKGTETAACKVYYWTLYKDRMTMSCSGK